MADSLVIHKEETIIKVRLEKAGVVLDEEVFPLDIYFNTVLLTSIDKLLKRNRIDKVSPLEVSLEGFEDESSMSSMIARTVVEALKIK